MRRELLPLLKLAGPVIMAEIGWMSMGIVDTLMVGPLGPAAIGATGMSSSLFFAFAVFGMGVMLGLDTLVSQSYGAGRLDDCVRWLKHGIALALVVGPALIALFYVALTGIGALGLNDEVRRLAVPYLFVIPLSGVPLLLYATFRRYLQGIHVVRPVMFALVSANLVNALGNWMLIYGRLGAPALGVEGAAWATVLARVYMAGFLFVAIVRTHRARRDVHPHVPFVFERDRIRRLLALGVPAASQITLEVGVFAAVSALAGKLDPVSLGAHQIALNMAALAFMVPLGLSSAGAVRVGHAVGGRDPDRARHAGWTALGLGAVVMATIGLTFIAFPLPLLRPFSDDASLLAIGVQLLAIGAAFQLFDGTQAVATGVLRGIGDTRTPMTVNVIGHWVFGLPVGYALCFGAGWGVAGLWVGLCVGLTFVAIVLTIAWHRKSRVLVAHSPEPKFGPTY
jgi:multidrug resistance protein, MATE family